MNGKLESKQARQGMKLHIKSIVIATLTLAVILLAVKLYAASPNPPKPQVWTPGCVAQVPRAWGTYRGASAQSGLAFEDSGGSIRFLTNIPCDGVPTVSLEIRRTISPPSIQ
jgi:hypothetical protein